METLALLGGLVAVATALGLAIRMSAGRARRTRSAGVLGAADAGIALGANATLLQFSSETCAPCRVAARVLGTLARERDGVAHVEVDVAAHPELVARFGVLQTPTTVLLDRDGVPRWRIGGAPRPREAEAALEKTLAAVAPAKEARSS